MTLRDTLRGTGVALGTPFNHRLEVDFDALGKVIEFVIHGGVEYLVVLGTTGEVPTLERSEKIEIINYTYERVQNKLPVVVGIGGNNTQEILNDVETYPLSNATAVLSTSPYYNRPSQQ